MNLIIRYMCLGQQSQSQAKHCPFSMIVDGNPYSLMHGAPLTSKVQETDIYIQIISKTYFLREVLFGQTNKGLHSHVGY